MTSLLPFLLLGGRGGGGKFFSKGMLKKVLMWTMMAGSPMLMLMGGFDVMDFLLMPMLAPLFTGMFGGLFGGGGAPAGGSVA